MRFLEAEQVFDGKKFLPPSVLLVLDDAGKLHDILPDHTIENGRIEKLKGIITPGFVNAHCHIELSHLRGKITELTGLPDFGRQVILQRNLAKKEEIAEQVKDANTEMFNSGIVAVGDISNEETSFKIKAESRIFYHTFVELIGLNPAVCEGVFKRGVDLLGTLKQFGLRGSLAPHAPYSTSNELIAKIAAFDFKNGLPFSMHNQESIEEKKFFAGDKSGFDDLYQFLNIDISWFKAPGHSSLKNYVNFISGGPSILVHNTITEASDLAAANQKNIYWCFCPSANLYIENKLPDFEIFGNQIRKICLGTDSLASNSQLNLVKEANIVLKANPQFSLEKVLNFMTNNGAEALEISDNFGNLVIGKNAGLNLIENKSSEIRFIKKIV